MPLGVELIEKIPYLSDSELPDGKTLADSNETVQHLILYTQFIDETGLLTREFEDEDAIRAVIDTWPDFCKEKGVSLSSGWREMFISKLHTSQFFLCFDVGLGSLFAFAVIKKVASKEQTV